MELLKEGASISPATQTLLNCVIKLEHTYMEIYNALSLVYTEVGCDAIVINSIDPKHEELVTALMGVIGDVIKTNLNEHKQTI